LIVKRTNIDTTIEKQPHYVQIAKMARR
jgi:hypothetical protein